ncbi:hypothetical protein T12_9099 [Trichinella patagoniensis]|uniref:Uncharacterized protein n=1 Tax=Trichinella patagoniensis TaxID=990121 RepID=A0A0V0ZH06_9BILA|nr:hypothetical protein T12_9099 [Trichinella patagoniensis]
MKQFAVADLQRKDVFIYKVTLAFCSNFIIFIRLCIGAFEKKIQACLLNKTKLRAKCVPKSGKRNTIVACEIDLCKVMYKCVFGYSVGKSNNFCKNWSSCALFYVNALSSSLRRWNGNEVDCVFQAVFVAWTFCSTAAAFLYICLLLFSPWELHFNVENLVM